MEREVGPYDDVLRSWMGEERWKKRFLPVHQLFERVREGTPRGSRHTNLRDRVATSGWCLLCGQKVTATKGFLQTPTGSIAVHHAFNQARLTPCDRAWICGPENVDRFRVVSTANAMGPTVACSGFSVVYDEWIYVEKWVVDIAEQGSGLATSTYTWIHADEENRLPAVRALAAIGKDPTILYRRWSHGERSRDRSEGD